MRELKQLLIEIKEMIKVISDRQEWIMKSVNELKEENKQLKEEVKVNSFVINSMTPRNEIVN